jgi:hypothetical protein
LAYSRAKEPRFKVGQLVKRGDRIAKILAISLHESDWSQTKIWHALLAGKGPWSGWFRFVDLRQVKKK